MARAAITNVTVFSDKLYRANGDVHQWCEKITGRFGLEAKRAAPIRSGDLVDGIHWSTKRVGRKQVRGQITSESRHTMYVLRGTTGPIMTNARWANPQGAVKWEWKNVKTKAGIVHTYLPVRQKGYWMPIPDRATGVFAPPSQGHWAEVVDGQKANNFLLKAWKRTSYDHRAIRGKRIPRFLTNP